MISIRSAIIKDLAALVAIEQCVFVSNQYDLLSRRQFRYILTKANAVVLVALVDCTVVGYAMLFFRANARSGRLYSIAVLPQYQGGGVAKALFAACDQVLKERHCRSFLAEIRADNTAQLARYQQAGFTVVDVLSDYYPDGSSALKLKKNY